MGILSKLKPAFWDHHDAAAGVGDKPFSFRRKWKLIVLFTSLAALIPLMGMVLVEYRLNRNIIKADAIGGLAHQTQYAQNAASAFFSRQKTLVSYILLENSYEDLVRPGRLEDILTNLNTAGCSAVRLSILDDKNRLRVHAGPPHKKDLLTQIPEQLLKQRKGEAVFGYPDTGKKKMPLFGIAVRNTLLGNSFFTLVAQMNNQQLKDQLVLAAMDNAIDFSIVDAKGHVLISPRYNVNIRKIGSMTLTETGDHRGPSEAADQTGKGYLIDYTHIPETGFILVSLTPKTNMVDQWLKPRLKLVGFLIFSIIIIFLTIMAAATYIVNLIHNADRKRVKALHQVEYTNKLASIGMLASGVAHEINNPLAIINQKTGLIKDLFTLSQEYAEHPRLLGLVDDVLSAVERCGSITKRLLNFSRHMKSKVQRVNIADIIQEMVRFVERDAERRCIGIVTDMDKGIPEFEVNRGNLQQILLNLFNNAFAAMEEGGQLEIRIERQKTEMIRILVIDNGCGIPVEDIKRVFDPFFSTRHDHQGTGLGLSITYGLVKEIGGEIHVESTVGKGTRFIVEIPMMPPESGSPEADVCYYVDKSQ